VSNRPDIQRARNGAGVLVGIWLVGLAIFVSPFVLVNGGAGAGYGVALGIAWTVGVILFWVKIGLPAAREQARWESLEKARKEGRG